MDESTEETSENAEKSKVSEIPEQIEHPDNVEIRQKKDFKSKSKQSKSSKAAKKEDERLSWIAVSSDDECIPRIKVSSSSSSSSDEETSPSFIQGNGKSKNWQKEPLSIMWCLKSFDDGNSSQPSTSRVVLYDQQTVMALEAQNGSQNKKKKKRRKKRAKKVAKVAQSEPQLSSESIDSSPSSYRNDPQWTGYKIKQKWRPQIDTVDSD